MFTAERVAREDRMKAREGMKPLLDKLGSGERLSVEERADLDARNLAISAFEAEIKSYEAARELSAVVDTPEAPKVSAEESRERAFSDYVRSGRLSPEVRAAPDASPPNGQLVGTNSAGGYLVPPGWWQRLQVALKLYGGTANDFMPLMTESGQPMQWATINPTAVVGNLLGESTQVAEQDYTFGQGTLSAYTYTSNAQLVSFALANDSAFDMDAFVSDRVGEAIGRVRAQVAISGTGSAQPLGVNTALNGQGSVGTSGGTIAQTGGFVTLATAATVKNFNGSTTELASNTLNPQTTLSMITAVDPAYRAQGCKYYMNDQQLLGLRSQVDANGRPLINLQDGLTGDAHISTLYGYPIVLDPNIGNLTASTTGGPIFGHLQSAMVLRTVNMAGLLRLTERYADFLQVGYIGYVRFDMRSNDLRAAVTVKPAAS